MLHQSLQVRPQASLWISWGHVRSFVGWSLTCLLHPPAFFNSDWKAIYLLALRDRDDTRTHTHKHTHPSCPGGNCTSPRGNTFSRTGSTRDCEHNRLLETSSMFSESSCRSWSESEISSNCKTHSEGGYGNDQHFPDSPTWRGLCWLRPKRDQGW